MKKLFKQAFCYANTGANAMKRKFARRMLACLGLIGFIAISITAIGMTSADELSDFVNPYFITAAVIFPAFVMKRDPAPGTGGGGTEPTEDEKQLIQKITSEINTNFKKLMDESEDMRAVKALKTAFDSFKTAKSKEDYEGLQTRMNELALQIKGWKENPVKTTAKKSFVAALKDALSEKTDALKEVMAGKSKNIVLEIKAAGTITTSNIDAEGTDSIPYLLSEQEPGITRLPRRAPFFQQLLNVGRTTKKYVQYAEIKNPDGGAGMTGEGSAKTQADFDIIEASSQVKKVTSFIKTSKEALDDLDSLMSEIHNELMILVELKADNQTLSGDGTGNNLKGVLTYAQTFTGGDLAGTVTDANEFDVISAAINEVETAEVQSGENAGFMPNYVVMNNTDVVKMKLKKDKNNNYVFPYWHPNSNSVQEVPVIKNPRMTAGDFLVMDSTFANLRVREDVTITMGYENDDFTKNLITILAEKRLAHYVKSNHGKAFVKGTFTTAKALLEAVVEP